MKSEGGIPVVGFGCWVLYIRPIDKYSGYSKPSGENGVSVRGHI